VSRSGQSWASNWSQPVAVAMARYALSVHRFQSRGERTRAGNGAGQWWHWGSFPSLTMGRLVFSPHEKDGTISTDETESVKWEERDGAEVVADPARHCNLARGGSLVCLACLSLSRTPGRNGGGLNGAEREGRAHPFPSRSSLKTCPAKTHTSSVRLQKSQLSPGPCDSHFSVPSPTAESQIGNAKRGALAWACASSN